MISTKAANRINDAVDAELFATRSAYEDKFNSMHEAESIIYEEYEETAECLKRVKVGLKSAHCSLRNNSREDWQDNLDIALKKSIELTQEAVQLTAMIKKAVDYGTKH